MRDAARPRNPRSASTNLRTALKAPEPSPRRRCSPSAPAVKRTPHAVHLRARRATARTSIAEDALSPDGTAAVSVPYALCVAGTDHPFSSIPSTQPAASRPSCRPTIAAGCSSSAPARRRRRRADLPKMLNARLRIATLGYYEASVQMKANGGVFLVDDFGRQAAISPQNFLNRLIVPLERGYDHLNLVAARGTSISVPVRLHAGAAVEQPRARGAPGRRGLPAGGCTSRWRSPDPGRRAVSAPSGRPACRRGEHLSYDDRRRSTTLIDQWVSQPPTRRGPYRGVHPRDILKHVRARGEVSASVHRASTATPHRRGLRGVLPDGLTFGHAPRLLL